MPISASEIVLPSVVRLVVIVGVVKFHEETATLSSMVGEAQVPPNSPPGVAPTTISADKEPLAVPTR